MEETEEERRRLEAVSGCDDMAEDSERLFGFVTFCAAPGAEFAMRLSLLEFLQALKASDGLVSIFRGMSMNQLTRRDLPQQLQPNNASYPSKSRLFPLES